MRKPAFVLVLLQNAFFSFLHSDRILRVTQKNTFKQKSCGDV